MHAMENGISSIWQEHMSCIQISGSFRVQSSPVQSSPVQSSPVQSSPVKYSTVQYSTVQYSTVQYSTVQYSTVQYSTVQYSTVQYSTATLPTWLPKQPMPFNVISMHSVQNGPDPYVKYSQPAVYVIAQGTCHLGCTHSACTCYAECMDCTQALVIAIDSNCFTLQQTCDCLPPLVSFKV